MADARFAEHLDAPRGSVPDGASSGAAGGAACGDLVRISLRVQGDRVVAAGFDGSGCASARAAASAAATLADGAAILDAARIDARAIADELGGLMPATFHAAELAADALHRALGAALRADGQLAFAADRILVAMSGGVDSAVAATMSGVGGGDVVAVTLELWASPENDAETSCCSATAVRGARDLAHSLGLAHLTLDLRDEFRAGVVEPWIADHAAGITPNPCVACNGSVRLDAMVALADRLGAHTLVTGHYARMDEHGTLRTAADPTKDQSYVLAAVPLATRRRLRFPLGDLPKTEVRAIAERAGLSVAKKPDSMDLCFLAGTGRRAFLERHGGLAPRPGPIVDHATGLEIGRHDGVTDLTVGQRRGLGLAGGPWFVIAKDGDTVRVGPREALATRTVRLRDVTPLSGRPDRVRLRYRSRPIACTLKGDDLRLDEPALGAAPGQAAVLYDGDAVVGCGTIVGPL